MRTIEKPFAVVVTFALLWVGSPTCLGASEESEAPDESRELVERTYDVQGLARPFLEEPRTIHEAGSFLLRHPEAEGGGAGFVSFMEEPDPSEGIAELVLDLAGMHDEGEIDAEGRYLRVLQPAPVQERVAAILRELRTRTLLRMRIECLFVPLDVLEAVVPQWRAEAPLLPDAVFPKLMADPRTLLVAGAVRHAQMVGLGQADRRYFVSDYEVNQTGVVPVVNPVLELLIGGDRVEIQSRITPDRRAIRVDYGVERARMDARKERISRLFGDLELPQVKGTMLWSSAVVPAGKTLIAGGVSGGIDGQRSLALLIRARPIGPGGRVGAPEPPSMVREDGQSIRFYDLPVGLMPPYEGRPYAHVSDEPGGVLEVFGSDREQTLEAFRERMVSHAMSVLPEEVAETMGVRLLPWETGIAVVGPAAVHRFVEGYLRSVEALPHLAFIDLRLLRLPRSAYGALEAKLEDGILLRAGWESSLPEDATLLRCYATGFVGQQISLCRRHAETIVTDVECVSGGTGMAVVDVPDPIATRVDSGVTFDLRASETPGSDRVELECHGLWVETDTSRKCDVAMPYHTYPTSPQVVPSQDSQGAAAGKPVTEILEVQITVPSQVVRTYRGHVTLPTERDAILDAAAEGEEVQILVGSVRIVRP